MNPQEFIGWTPQQFQEAKRQAFQSMELGWRGTAGYNADPRAESDRFAKEWDSLEAQVFPKAPAAPLQQQAPAPFVPQPPVPLPPQELSPLAPTTPLAQPPSFAAPMQPAQPELDISQPLTPDAPLPIQGSQGELAPTKGFGKGPSNQQVSAPADLPQINSTASGAQMQGYGNSISRRGGGFGSGFAGQQTVFGAPNSAASSSPDISADLKKMLGNGLYNSI